MASTSGTNAQEQERIIVAPDNTVFRFLTRNGRVDVTSSVSLYQQPPGGRRLVMFKNSNKDNIVNYVRIEKSRTTEAMVVANYKENVLSNTFSIDQDLSKILTATEYKSESTDTFGNGCQRIDVTANDEGGDWKIEFTYFKGGYFNDANNVEYALNGASFFRIWRKYKLPLLGLLAGGDYSRVVLGGLLAGTTTVNHCWYDGRPSYLKRLPVPNIGYGHSLMKLRWSFNSHHNIVKMHDTRCDGRSLETAFEICDMNLDAFIDAIDGNHKVLLRIFRDISCGMMHAHAKGIVHCNLNPFNVFVKRYGRPQNAVPKIGGWSNSVEAQEVRLVTLDIYSFGRMMLRAFNDTHQIRDDYRANKDYYDHKKKFEADLVDLLDKAPLVHHLVNNCISSPENYYLSFTEIYIHFCFWKPGRHLELMQRTSDLMNEGGIEIIRTCLTASKADILGRKTNWKYGFPTKWVEDQIETNGYDPTYIPHLVTLVRNVSHHLYSRENIKRGGEPMWVSSLAFEWYVLRSFPKLFPAVYNSVKAARKKKANLLEEFF